MKKHIDNLLAGLAFAASFIAFFPAMVLAGNEADSSSAAKKLYQVNCFTCHGTGLPGAPQFGVELDWQTRITAGREVLYLHAREGMIGATNMLMPPRGGNSDLTDAEVKMLVDYMLDASGFSNAK